MTEKTDKIFVYGTLKTGQPRNSFLTKYGCEKIEGVATVKGTMFYSGAGFPQLHLEDLSGGIVCGELWKIKEEYHDKLVKELDRIEGVERRVTRRATALVYLGKAEHTAHVYCLGVVESGDWTLGMTKKGM